MHNLRIEEINFTKKEEIKGFEATNQKMDLSSVSSLPIDPSAAYNYDMGNFFTGKTTKLIKPCEEVQPQFNLNNEIITGGKVNQKWIPSTSLFVADHNLKDGKSTNLDEKEVQQFQYKIESPENDDWSSDDDHRLGIINDPGIGSGLTTPDVDLFKSADKILSVNSSR